MTNYRQIISYHSQFGHLYVPNQYIRIRYGQDAYFLETDELGFRNSTDKPQGKLKLLVLGDSYAAGDGVRNQDRFSDLMAWNIDIEVINLAVNGYGIDQQILVYEAFKDQIPHDAVLFAPHMDDLYRNLKHSRTGIDREGKAIEIPKPYFKHVNNELVLHNVPVPKKRLESETQKERSNSSKLPKSLHELKNKTKNLVNQTLGKHLVGKLSYPELNDENSEEWELANMLIQKLISMMGSKQLFIMPIPYNYIIETNEPQYYVNIFNKFLSNNVSVIDLLPGLQNGFEKYPNDFFLPLCGHFTPIAHRVTCNILTDNLKLKLKLSQRKTKATSKKKECIYVLGISCFYHDSAASLIKDGMVIAAAQEERFTRKKHDPGFPTNAIHYCLEEGKIDINDLEAICYYDNPGKTLERVIHNAASLDTTASEKFWKLASSSMFRKLNLPTIFQEQFNYRGEIWQTEHHMSHAASAYFPSPFESASILVIDGVGEWACSTIAHGKDASIRILKQQHYPHSIGLLYSAFTYFCGFKVNSGEYKLMGLAPYGKPKYSEVIKDKVVNIHSDGSIALNLDLFNFMKGETMTNENFAKLFDGPKREAESQISQREMDLAASIQEITEEVVLKMAEYAKTITGERNLVLAGGVALNCVANGVLLRENLFEDIWIQPAAGDAGGALGAALDYYFGKNHVGSKIPLHTKQTHSYFGPEFSDDEILAFLETNDLVYKKFDKHTREVTLAEFLSQDNIIGYLDGRMEFGPRALAHRSIIGDPTKPEMQRKFNLKIKYRESFRPFAPIVLEENLSDYFEIDRPSPYMLFVAPVKKNIRVNLKEISNSEDMLERVNQVRSELPSITHVDYSARLQSVNKTNNKNEKIHTLLKNVKEKNGYGVLINTSFNVRGEPIVCSPLDAYRCFMRTEMDILTLGNFYLIKEEQPIWEEKENWQETFELD